MSTLHDHSPHIHGFIARPPSPALAVYVQRFWWIRSDATTVHDTQLLHPDGGSGVIFNFADPVKFDGVSRPHAAIVAGPQVISSRLQLAGQVNLMGVRFRPGMGAVFLGVGLDEVPGFQSEDWPSLQLTRLIDALAGLDASSQQALVERALMARLSDAEARRSPVQRLLAQITVNQGRARLTDLMQAVPLGQRQLERLFRHQVGLTPKQFSRIQRVALVRGQLRAGESLLDTALLCGYADQAHFINDFKAVVGMTPGQYRLRSQVAGP